MPSLLQIQKADPGYGVGINPISRLIQIQQAKKEKEPLYSLVSERGMPRRREFVMEVSGGPECTPETEVHVGATVLGEGKFDVRTGREFVIEVRDAPV